MRSVLRCLCMCGALRRGAVQPPSASTSRTLRA
jgi:hypothetical protein